jgi:zinc transport system ATP-binding protein
VTAPDAAPVIAMSGVAVGYDDRPAVRDIDFRLDHGEVVALVGPNGSGKTTLVRGILGLARVLEGEVELFGVPADRFAERYRIGYVPQRHTVGGAIPSTVTEVVSSGRLPRHRLLSRLGAADRDAVSRAIASVGLTDQRTASVATLSGGQQRRVLIARALATDPEVLIMDEPTAGIDAESHANLVRTLAGLVRRGLTMLVVTHQVTPLLPILTRVVAMDAGRIVHDGPAPVAGPGGSEPVAVPDHDPGHDQHHTPTPPFGRPGDRVSAPAPGWLGEPGTST